MVDVPNIFDLVPSPKKDDAQSQSTRRPCGYRSRLGNPCNRDAREGALVCDLHGGAKSSLIQIRREMANLGPLAVEQLEDLMIAEEGVVRLGAIKLWSEIAGMKDLPSNTGVDEEELDAARRSLSRKLESVAERVLQRKTA